jgi:hypothetical protein
MPHFEHNICTASGTVDEIRSRRKREANTALDLIGANGTYLRGFRL